jgi:hypothetical protein
MSDPIFEASARADTTMAFSVTNPVGMGAGTFLQLINRMVPSRKPVKRIIGNIFSKR